MKRDMELIRKILLTIESSPPRGGDRSFSTLGYPEDDVTYNIDQAIQAGLLRGQTMETTTSMVCLVDGLTPYGHDFLENAKNQFIWDEVMEDAKKRGIATASIDILKQMLDKAIRKRIDL
jgi:hypothetical protein